MSQQPVDFYYDFVSPFAYLAWLRINELSRERGFTFTPRPVLFAGLLNHWGQLGPAEIPPKRVFIFKDAMRSAARRGYPFTLPKLHPFNPLVALRVSLPEVSGERQRQAIDAIYKAGWARGEDISSPEEIIQALDGAGLDGAALVARAGEPEPKAALRRQTEAAIQRGVFGVPTMIAGDELFWGSDQLDNLALFLAGEDPLDPEVAKAQLARYQGVGAERRRPGKDGPES